MLKIPVVKVLANVEAHFHSCFVTSSNVSAQTDFLVYTDLLIAWSFVEILSGRWYMLGIDQSWIGVSTKVVRIQLGRIPCGLRYGILVWKHYRQRHVSALSYKCMCKFVVDEELIAFRGSCSRV